jgi:uncharacterized membrane protein
MTVLMMQTSMTIAYLLTSACANCLTMSLIEAEKIALDYSLDEEFGS